VYCKLFTAKADGERNWLLPGDGQGLEQTRLGLSLLVPSARLQQEIPLHAVEFRCEGRQPVLAHHGACLCQHRAAGVELAGAPVEISQQTQAAGQDEPRPGSPVRGEPLLHLGDTRLHLALRRQSPAVIHRPQGAPVGQLLLSRQGDDSLRPLLHRLPIAAVLMQEGGTVQAEQQAHGVSELAGQVQDGVEPCQCLVGIPPEPQGLTQKVQADDGRVLAVAVDMGAVLFRAVEGPPGLQVGAARLQCAACHQEGAQRSVRFHK
jgi:hypothetical protein